jgi:hypothetical protein
VYFAAGVCAPVRYGRAPALSLSSRNGSRSGTFLFRIG